MKVGDLLHCRQGSERLMKNHGELFIVVHSDEAMSRVMVHSLKTGKRRRLSKKRFEVISESR